MDPNLPTPAQIFNLGKDLVSLGKDIIGYLWAALLGVIALLHRNLQSSSIALKKEVVEIFAELKAQIAKMQQDQTIKNEQYQTQIAEFRTDIAVILTRLHPIEKMSQDVHNISEQEKKVLNLALDQMKQMAEDFKRERQDFFKIIQSYTPVESLEKKQKRFKAKILRELKTAKKELLA